MATRRAPTIDDVARAADVSITTVSRVVRNHADVRDVTRARVQAAIDELGYRPSPIARALVRGRTQTLALLMSDIANPFYPQLAKVIESEASRRDYIVVMCGTDDDRSQARRRVRRLVDQGVDGLIHASVGEDEEAVLALMDPGRVVFTNRRPARPDCNYVVSDNRAGARALTEHLIAAGHRRIGFVGGPEYASNARERLEAFRATVAEHAGVTALVAEGEFSPDTGARAARAWLAGDAPPTAMIGVNDSVAVGALEAVLDAGLDVPGDIAVAGFDGIQLTSSRTLEMTTVSQHIEEMGRRAVAAILRLLGGNPPRRPIHEVLEPTLVVRHTTGGARP
jgi:LacI family transcriptional regulator